MSLHEPLRRVGGHAPGTALCPRVQHAQDCSADCVMSLQKPLRRVGGQESISWRIDPVELWFQIQPCDLSWVIVRRLLRRSPRGCSTPCALDFRISPVTSARSLSKGCCAARHEAAALPSPSAQGSHGAWGEQSTGNNIPLRESLIPRSLPSLSCHLDPKVWLYPSPSAITPTYTYAFVPVHAPSG